MEFWSGYSADTDHIYLVQVQFSYRFLVIIYRGTSVFLCGIIFISVVERHFLLYV